MDQISLRAARVNAKYTQVAAAKMLGIAVSTLRNWENGITFPRQPQIKAICDLYKVNIDAIFFE